MHTLDRLYLGQGLLDVGVRDRLGLSLHEDPDHVLEDSDGGDQRYDGEQESADRVCHLGRGSHRLDDERSYQDPHGLDEIAKDVNGSCSDIDVTPVVAAGAVVTVASMTVPMSGYTMKKQTQYDVKHHSAPEKEAQSSYYEVLKKFLHPKVP